MKFFSQTLIVLTLVAIRGGAAFSQTTPSAPAANQATAPAAPTGTQGMVSGQGQATQVELTRINGSLNAIQKTVDELKERHWIRDVGPTLASILSLAVAIVALIISSRHNRKSLEEKSREEERKSIREKLDQFYGPLLQLRGVSKNLYEIFNARRQGPDDAQYRNAQGKFRTLHALINGYEFDGIDAVILAQINDIGLQSEKLISDKVGLVDDSGLQDLLWKLATHYRIFDLARAKKLTGGGEEFTSFSFPYQVDGELQAKAKELNARLDELQSVR